MKTKKHLFKTAFIIIVGMLCLTGCSGTGSGNAAKANPDTIEGTWDSVEVGVDGSMFTFEELEAVGGVYVEETTLIFKEGSKAIITDPEADYTYMCSWKETGEEAWKIYDSTGGYEITKDGDRIVMTYDDYGTEISLYFEKTSDSQEVPTTEEESEETSEQ